MKRIVFISVIMLFAAVAAFAQDDGRRKMTRKERKALQARVDSMLHARADSAMLDSAFVLEADEVMFKRGYTAHVTSSTNFVSVSGDKAVVQVAFNVPWSGFNGMGGITVEGRISQYERKTDKAGQKKNPHRLLSIRRRTGPFHLQHLNIRQFAIVNIAILLFHGYLLV